MAASTLFLACTPNQGKPLIDVTGSAHRVRLLDQYALNESELMAHRGLIVSMMADQRWLLKQKPLLSAWLAKGGRMIINGHIGWCFLDCLQRFEAIPEPDMEAFKVQRHLDHPVFRGVEPLSLNMRRGVAGFWGRGENPPPHGAQMIHSLDQGRVAVDWVYETEGGGQILVHAGVEMWGALEKPKDSQKLFLQTLDWIEEAA